VQEEDEEEEKLAEEEQLQEEEEEEEKLAEEEQVQQEEEKEGKEKSQIWQRRPVHHSQLCQLHQMQEEEVTTQVQDQPTTCFLVMSNPEMSNPEMSCLI
jgi:aconitase A